MSKYLNLREIQLEELKILLEVKKIIEENKLRYSLTGGTLLGAVRHKGFIPWDDDIDICMPRNDYEKLIEIFDKNNKSNHLELQCYEKNNSFQPFAKVVNKKIELIDSSICDQERRYLWIDIMPVDGMPDDDKKLRKLFKINRRLAKLLYISHYSILKDKYSSLLKKICKMIIKPYALLYNGNSIIKNSKMYDYEKSEYVGCSVWGYGPQEKNLKEYMDEFVDINFEGHIFKSFKGYDQYLKNLYGDYMTLPPIEKRATHHITAWYVEK